MADPEEQSSSCCCCFRLPRRRRASRRARPAAGTANNTDLTEPLNPALEDPDDEVDAAKLQNILTELLSTERAYVAALDALVNRYLPVIRPHLDATQAELTELCMTAISLHGVHRELLERLEIIGGDVIGSDVVHDPGRNCDAGSAEIGLGDLLAKRRLHHGWPCRKNGGIGSHDREVAQGCSDRPMTG